METWPVSPRCEPFLQDLLQTHDICPVPALNNKHQVIPPSQYQKQLKGAIVEAHFSFCHHFIKKSRRHIYSTVLRKLVVLSPPSNPPSSPHKRLRIAASTKNKGKSKART